IGGDSAWNLVAPLLLGLCGAYACWASGGLETQLFTFLITLGFALYLSGRRLSAGAFALVALTPPGGHLYFGLVVRQRGNLCRGRRVDLGWMALYLVIYGPYFAWRYFYYGIERHWLAPNTFYIKSSGGTGTAHRGLFYLGRFLHDYGLWLVLPLA